MKKILLYLLSATLSVVVVSALFVVGVFNFSSGTANLIGAEVGLHGSSELDIHNQIISNIHYIGNKTKWVDSAINMEGDITDEVLIKAFVSTGENIQTKLKDLTALFDRTTFTNDKQIIEDTFLNDYKPAAEELSYLLIDLKGKVEKNIKTGIEETNTDEKIDNEAVVAKAVSTAKKVVVGTAIPITFEPITQDKKTQIINSCAKLIEAHNKFSDVLNQKRRY